MRNTQNPDEPDADEHYTGPKLKTRDLNVHYGDTHAIKNASIDIQGQEVMALMGPSGCGKSTFLRCLNRMNDSISTARITGTVELEGRDIYERSVDPARVRARVGMVAQAPNPFPKSIYANVAFGPRLHGLVDDHHQLDELVEDSLRRAGLWDEVKDNLDQPGTSLSGGQQQRLCIARAIALTPEVILMDEPASSLDPKSTATVEELIRELGEDFTIVIVTHNMQEAKRVAKRTAFFYLGELIEVRETDAIFEDAHDERTKEYLSGAFG